MKSQIRLTPRPCHGDVEIRAKLKATGKFAVFGYCHPATATLIHKDGIKPHVHLVRLPE